MVGDWRGAPVFYEADEEAKSTNPSTNHTHLLRASFVVEDIPRGPEEVLIVVGTWIDWHVERSVRLQQTRSGVYCGEVPAKEGEYEYKVGRLHLDTSQVMLEDGPNRRLILNPGVGKTYVARPVWRTASATGRARTEYTIGGDVRLVDDSGSEILSEEERNKLMRHLEDRK